MPKAGESRRLFASPSTLSGCSVSHNTGSAACPWPVKRSVGSISCGRNCSGANCPPLTLYGRLCQVRNAARLGVEAAGEAQ